MIKRILLSATIAVIAVGYFSTPVLAGHCPRDVKKINAAMSKMDGNKMSMAKEAAAKGRTPWRPRGRAPAGGRY